MIKENVWDNEFHEDLFKLFVLASNGYIIHMSDYDSIHHKICENVTENVPMRYSFQFNDRSAHEEEEFDGLIYWDKGERQFAVKDDQYNLRKYWCGKIKFRFVENEND